MDFSIEITTMIYSFVSAADVAKTAATTLAGGAAAAGACSASEKGCSGVDDPTLSNMLNNTPPDTGRCGGGERSRGGGDVKDFYIFRQGIAES